jgi:putative transcriptional regulator
MTKVPTALIEVAPFSTRAPEICHPLSEEEVMSRKRNIGEEIIQGLEQAVAHGRGEKVSVKVTVVQVPQEVDVKAIRKRRGLTQPQFAARYGFALTALQEWEKKRRRPDRAARVLLKVIDKDPEAVERALAS